MGVDPVWLSLVQQHRAIAVIRAPQLELGRQMAKAVAAGGIRLIEITWTSDRPSALVEQLSIDLPHCRIGAGTLLNRYHLQEAIVAGATFLFSPHSSSDLIHFAVDQGIPFIPGALTPTEIVTAWQAGAASVKVFPIQSVGGADYIRNLQGPLGSIPLIPTGGVTVANARDFLNAGAIAVGISSELFPKQAIATGDWSCITQRARELVNSLESLLDLKLFPIPYTGL